MKTKAFLIIIAVIVASCSTRNNKEKLAPTIISGTIENYEQPELTLYSLDQAIKEGISVTFPMNEDGSFRDTLDVKIEEGRYFLKNAKNYLELYLKEGSDIEVHYDATQFPQSVKIGGNGAEISQYLLKKRLNRESLREKKIYSLAENDFKKLNTEVQEETIQLLNSFSGIPDDFKQKETSNLYYDYLLGLQDYIISHTPTNRWFKEGDFIASDSLRNEFRNEFEKLDLNNEQDFLFSKSFGYLIYQNIEDKVNKLVASDSTLDKNTELLKAFAKIQNKTVRNDMIYRIGTNEDMVFTENNNWLYEVLIDAYSERYKNLKPLNPIPETVAKGNSSPKFVDFENLAGGTTSLDDFKGKYVYIDLWATWCFPCRAEIPFLKKIEEDYHDKNIAFVSISMDRDQEYEKLKKLVVEKNLTGVQLYANGQGYDADFSKAYGVTYIPRFLLIDPDGNIVDAIAPRPSDKRLRTLLDEVLN